MRDILPERLNFGQHFPREGGVTAIYLERQKRENLLTVSDENTILFPINIKNNDLEPIDFSDMLSLICATLLCFCICTGLLPSTAVFISRGEIFPLIGAISYYENKQVVFLVYALL